MNVRLRIKGFVMVSFLLMTSCFHQDNEIIYEVKNIRTKQKAILSLTPAELNIGDIYHVFILFDNEDLKTNDYGIVFSVNDWDNVLPRDTSKIKINWLLGDTIKISYDRKLRIYNQVIKTRDNVIVYEPIN